MLHQAVKLLCVVVLLIALGDSIHYVPTWESIDSRPLPTWYDQAKVGIMIHWGVFSVPSFSNEWFWWRWKGEPVPSVLEFLKQNYKPDWTYADFAKDLTAEFFDPDQWAELFNASGARYVVQVTKHHEGFTSWPSKHSFNWNSGAVGPKRDIVGELAASIRNKTNLHYGVYHSLFEWFNPLYMQDHANNFTTREFVTTKTMPELYELVNIYKPEIIFSDGALGPTQYWQSLEFLAWLYNDSPVKDIVVVNDRWGHGTRCTHGGYYTCKDRYNPKVLQKHKFENAMTISRHSWGYVRTANLSYFLTIDSIITELVQTVSCGGNLLVNVGPTKEGTITPIYEERLRQLGSWLAVNGEAIYETRPWRKQNDTINSDVWYTVRPESPRTVYALVLNWTLGKTLVLGAPITSSNTTVTLLGYKHPFKWTAKGSAGMEIDIPFMSLQEIPTLQAWALKLTDVS